MLHSGSGSALGTSGSTGPFAPPPDTLSFTVTWTVGNTVCEYKFYSGPGGTGTLLKTVKLTYISPQVVDLVSGEVS